VSNMDYVPLAKLRDQLLLVFPVLLRQHRTHRLAFLIRHCYTHSCFSIHLLIRTNNGKIVESYYLITVSLRQSQSTSSPSSSSSTMQQSHARGAAVGFSRQSAVSYRVNLYSLPPGRAPSESSVIGVPSLIRNLRPVAACYPFHLRGIVHCHTTI
jgi:hypothetical protein